MFLASLAYLPLALCLMLADRGPGRAADMWLHAAPRSVEVTAVEAAR
ncbi:MAG: hypothetical protein R3D98_00400 [Candidatus Krumholzibacteriia bacterium]